jgi:hypothetical protein
MSGIGVTSRRSHARSTANTIAAMAWHLRHSNRKLLAVAPGVHCEELYLPDWKDDMIVDLQHQVRNLRHEVRNLSICLAWGSHRITGPATSDEGPWL